MRQWNSRDGSLLSRSGSSRRWNFAIDTRDGLKYLAVPESGEISVNMGKVLDLSDVDGSATILQSGNEWKSFNINVGNPHAVAIISDLAQVGDLASAPGVTPDDVYPEE